MCNFVGLEQHASHLLALVSSRMGWERIFSLPAKWTSHPEVFRSIWKGIFFFGLSCVCKSHPLCSFAVARFTKSGSRWQKCCGWRRHSRPSAKNRMNILKAFFNSATSLSVMRRGITHKANHWRPPPTVSVYQCLLRWCSLGFLSMIRAEENPDLNSCRPICDLRLIRPGFCFHRCCTNTQAHPRRCGVTVW